MQPFDYTTLLAVCCEIRSQWVPARLEQVYQWDRHQLTIGLRTLTGRGWLTLCWHPQAAHFCMGNAPPRIPDTFTFSQQLHHQLVGLALVGMYPIAPWERVLVLQFAHRPGEAPLWTVYVEIMGKYSNVILVNGDGIIVTAAHQVSHSQSRVRSVQTGQPYEVPPELTQVVPHVTETMQRWQSRLTLIPGSLKKRILQTYRGLSSALVESMLDEAKLDYNQFTDQLDLDQWQRLFGCWESWLSTLATADHLWQFTNPPPTAPPVQFRPGWTRSGYSVMGWGTIQSTTLTLQNLIDQYYKKHLHEQRFDQLRVQLGQKISAVAAKLRTKAQLFDEQLEQAEQADAYRQYADLVMANLQMCQTGLCQLSVPDFESGCSVKIPLDPNQSGIQNAQAFYKRHQKLRRSRLAVEPLRTAVYLELGYVEAVESMLTQFNRYHDENDWLALVEIQQELIQQGYGLEKSTHSQNKPKRTRGKTKHTGKDRGIVDESSQPLQYFSPNGFEVLIGRNNRQNDRLTGRTAGDYDLWFHTQEIPGSHVLLRLPPGAVADTSDLQFVANLAAYYSRARQSVQVPVVYTQPRHVYKPKGAKPGMVIYRHERIIWGQPQHVHTILGRDNNGM